MKSASTEWLNLAGNNNERPNLKIWLFLEKKNLGKSKNCIDSVTEKQK